MAEISTNKNIIGIITSLHRGGAERHIIYLLKHEVISDLFLLENKIEYEIDNEKAKSVKPLILSNRIKSTLLKYLLIPVYSFRFSRKIKKNSIVISFVERADMVNVFSKLFIKHKSIISILIDPLRAYGGLKYPLFLIMKVVYAFSDIIITNSKGATEFLKKSEFLKNKVFTIYNPISVEIIQHKSEEELSNSEKKLFLEYPVFINVGRLTDQKGQWHLLRIFKQVKINIPNAKLVIIGDGRLRRYLTNLSKELGLKTFINWNNDKFDDSYDVYFLGSQENPFKFVTNSSIFVYPTLFEGFPNVILEALVCGIPIISSDCRFGPREILAPETDFTHETKIPEYGSYGLLMPVLNNKKKMASDLLSKEEIIWSQSIIDLYNNKVIYDKYRNSSLERVKNFDIDIIIPEWKNLLNN